MARAFARDPLWSHALARADGHTAHQVLFWRLFVDSALPHSWVWLASGDAAASVWIPPGVAEMRPEEEEELAGLAHQHLEPAGASAFLELLERFEAAHPREEPHYYLSLLATHPDHRGNGIGMALLAHDLELVDAEGLPAYLESTNPANDRRYRAVGFEPFGAFSYPGGGPVVTTMWRPARSPGTAQLPKSRE